MSCTVRGYDQGIVCTAFFYGEKAIVTKSSMARIAHHRASHVRIWRLLQEKKRASANNPDGAGTGPKPVPMPDIYTLPLPLDQDSPDQGNKSS